MKTFERWEGSEVDKRGGFLVARRKKERMDSVVHGDTHERRQSRISKIN